MTKSQLGQFYTKNSEYITQGLLTIFPSGATIVDMFAGEMDLLRLVIDKHPVEAYDIDPRSEQVIRRDTLMNPPDYGIKWVMTNPPYLARNKNKDKKIYQKWRSDDLYKAAILSMMGCHGGVVVVPLNFWSSEDDEIRTKFLSEYVVARVNVFEEKAFEDTSYTVCSFSFNHEKNDEQVVPMHFFPSGQVMEFHLKKEEGYRVGNEVHNLDKSSVKVSRLMTGEDPNTNLFLHAIDTGADNGRIRLIVRDNPYYGRPSDRAFCSIKFNRDFTIDQQYEIARLFNEKLENYRAKYKSLFLSQYRNSTLSVARKRIGFNMAYDFISHVILELGYDVPVPVVSLAV